MGTKKLKTKKGSELDWDEYFTDEDFVGSEFGCSIVFLKWIYSPYDFAIIEEEENHNDLVLKASTLILNLNLGFI